jgi:hypothetical protein
MHLWEKWYWKVSAYSHTDRIILPDTGSVKIHGQQIGKDLNSQNRLEY